MQRGELIYKGADTQRRADERQVRSGGRRMTVRPKHPAGPSAPLGRRGKRQASADQDRDCHPAGPSELASGVTPARSVSRARQRGERSRKIAKRQQVPSPSVGSQFPLQGQLIPAGTRSGQVTAQLYEEHVYGTECFRRKESQVKAKGKVRKGVTGHRK